MFSFILYFFRRKNSPKFVTSIWSWNKSTNNKSYLLFKQKNKKRKCNDLSISQAKRHIYKINHKNIDTYTSKIETIKMKWPYELNKKKNKN